AGCSKRPAPRHPPQRHDDGSFRAQTSPVIPFRRNSLTEALCRDRDRYHFGFRSANRRADEACTVDRLLSLRSHNGEDQSGEGPFGLLPRYLSSRKPIIVIASPPKPP